MIVEPEDRWAPEPVELVQVPAPERVYLEQPDQVEQPRPRVGFR